jgi:hypothetical protein
MTEGKYKLHLRTQNQIHPHTMSVAVAVDVEGTGAAFDAPIVAVGVCVGDLETKRVMECRTWCMKMPEGVAVEPRCQAEFWDKHPDLWGKIERDAVSQSTAFRSLAVFLDRVYDEARTAGKDILILSDNPAYDLPRIDAGLHRHADRLPLRYRADGTYLFVADPTERAAGMERGADECVAFANREAPPTHWPSDDATNIFALHCVLETWKHRQRRLAHRLGIEWKKTTAVLKKIQDNADESDT